MRLGASHYHAATQEPETDEPLIGCHSHVFHLIPPSFRRFPSIPQQSSRAGAVFQLSQTELVLLSSEIVVHKVML